MARYLLKRLGLALVTLLVLSFIVFLAGQLLPGDPGRAILGNLAPQAAVRQLDHQLGVDKPFLDQYWHWLTGLLHGNLGESYQFRSPVSDFLWPALRNSAKLAGLAFVIMVPLSVAGGVVAALNQGKWIDRLISSFGLSGSTVPEFVTGIVCIEIFVLGLHWLPISASSNEGGSSASAPFFTQLHHLILPAIPLVVEFFGYIARITRAGTVEALASDYVRTAVLKGLPRHVVIIRHALRNSLLPAITVIASQVGYLIGGLVVIEDLFDYQGLGLLIFNAAKNKDFRMLEAGVLTIGVIYMLATLLADVAYSYLNPRIRLGSSS